MLIPGAFVYYHDQWGFIMDFFLFDHVFGNIYINEDIFRLPESLI